MAGNIDSDEVSLTLQDVTEGGDDNGGDINNELNNQIKQAVQKFHHIQEISMPRGEEVATNAFQRSQIQGGNTLANENEYFQQDYTATPVPAPTAVCRPTMATQHPGSTNIASRHISPGTPSVMNTPSSQHSRATLLAALYHSSRRSRHTDSPAAKGIFNPAAIRHVVLPPPPPLATASPPNTTSVKPNATFGGSNYGSNNPTAQFRVSNSSTEPSQSLLSSVGHNSNSSMSVFHDSWNTSMGSLIGNNSTNFGGLQWAGFHAAPPLYNPTTNEQDVGGSIKGTAKGTNCPPRSQGLHPSTSNHTDYMQTPITAKEAISFQVAPPPNLEYTPDTNMDRKLLNLANDSTANMCMQQLSRFTFKKERSTRSRSEFEDASSFEDETNMSEGPDADGKKKSNGCIDVECDGSASEEGPLDSPPRKKSKGRNLLSESYKKEQAILHAPADLYKETIVPTNFSDAEQPARPPTVTKMSSLEYTPESMRSTLSFDIIANQSADVSPMNDELIMKDSIANRLVVVQGHHSQGHEEEGTNEQEQRVIRRKVERLLLIRHATRCTVPVPPSSLSIQESSTPITPTDQQCICPVTSHCAEGKALCAHIKTCKKEKCTYKKCLTSREALGHYRSCKDRRCQICGPVRALHSKHKRERTQHEQQEPPPPQEIVTKTGDDTQLSGSSIEASADSDDAHNNTTRAPANRVYLPSSSYAKTPNATPMPRAA